MIKNHSHPEKAAIDDEKINDNLILITLTVNGFLKTGIKLTLNDDCSIKSREAFFEELESILNKNKDETVIMALSSIDDQWQSWWAISLKNRFSH
jgi:hypothetical protein